MTAEGEVFAEVKRGAPGPDAYLQQINDLLGSGKKELDGVKKLTEAFKRAKKDEDRNRALDAILGKLAEMSPSSYFIAPLADVVLSAFGATKGDRRKACVEALVNAGSVDANLVAEAKRIDPDGSLGLWVKAVNALTDNLRSEEDVLTAMEAIEDLFANIKSVPNDPGKFLCANMSGWSFRFKEDEAAAAMWAKRGLEMIKDSEDPQDDRMRKWLEDMLEE